MSKIHTILLQFEKMAMLKNNLCQTCIFFLIGTPFATIIVKILTNNGE